MRASKLPVFGLRAAMLLPSSQFALGMLAKRRPDVLSQAKSAVCKDSSATELVGSGLPTGNSSRTTLLERFGSSESLVRLATEASRPALRVWSFTVTITVPPAGMIKGDETTPPLLGEFVPEVELVEMKEEFAGNICARTTFCAVFGPWFEIVSVYVSVFPVGTGNGGETTERRRSAGGPLETRGVRNKAIRELLARMAKPFVPQRRRLPAAPVTPGRAVAPTANKVFWS